MLEASPHNTQSKRRLYRIFLNCIFIASKIINKAIFNKKKICAVGTTVMRGLESSVSSMGTLNPYKGWTHKFIFPPYDFSIANCMITNFHTPKSTLLMMASAFADPEFIKSAYQEAIKEKYNFYSYGDNRIILFEKKTKYPKSIKYISSS